MMKCKPDSLDWSKIGDGINDKGYALLSNFVTNEECDSLAGMYEEPTRFRKTVVMERHRFGLGEYKYFDYPLPNRLKSIRESVYSHLVPLANSWMKALKTGIEYPSTLPELQARCREQNQTKSTVLILRYNQGGYNTLHQDLYGDVYFPIQMVLFLSEYGKDYSGGEFVLTEQAPRSQSKAMVLKPAKGDALLFTTNFRPIKGTKGHYRVKMRHGVSEVSQGSRCTLGIIFHDALD